MTPRVVTWEKQSRTTNRDSMGWRCYNRRLELELSTSMLSDKSNIERTLLIKVETGENKQLRANTACMLAKALGVTTDYLVMGWKPKLRR